MAILGVIAGGYILKQLSNETFLLLLIVLITVMFVLSYTVEKRPVNLNQHPVISYSVGFIAGAISMIGNAAGPFLGSYLLAVVQDKSDYIAIRARFFLIINTLKFLVLIFIGIMSIETLWMGVYTLPGVLLGSFLGYLFMQKINITAFKRLIQMMILIALVRMIYAYLYL